MEQVRPLHLYVPDLQPARLATPAEVHKRLYPLVVEGAGAQVTWCWAIIPTDSRTRLVSRVRVRVGTRLLLWILAPVIDLPWFMMERQMLHGVARRAEALARSRRDDS